MTDSNTLILPYTEIRATDLPLVGGKGANLGELIYAGFPVPPGFCLTTAAFQEFMDSASNSAELYDLLDPVTAQDMEAIRNAGARMREALSTVPIPADIVSATRNGWPQHGLPEARKQIPAYKSRKCGSTDYWGPDTQGRGSTEQ